MKHILPIIVVLSLGCEQMLYDCHAPVLEPSDEGFAVEPVEQPSQPPEPGIDAEQVQEIVNEKFAKPLADLAAALEKLNQREREFEAAREVKPAVGTKPVGTITVDVWERGCPACDQLKQDVKNYTGLKFVYRVVTSTAPILRWKIGNTIWTHEGWPGLQQFIDAYNASLPAATSQTSVEQAPTPIAEVRRVLNLLRPQTHETFVDYGCGDGRWLIEAARTYRCRAVGVEIDPEQVAKARQAVAAAGLTHMVTIVEGDVLTANVEAQVGVAYLYPDLLERLKPKLLKLNRFATYMHQVQGVAMRQSGDAWIWQRPAVVPVQQRYAYYDGQAYSGPVCNNPRCRMCREIARQLGM